MPMTSETFAIGTTSVPIDVFVPDATPHRRAVLVLHGSAGLGPEYRKDIVSFAEALIAKLKTAGKSEGRDFRYEQYPGQSHRFDSTALAGARATTVDFIDSRL